MSRIGKAPIAIPDGVTVKVENGVVTVKGKNGELTLEHHPLMKVVVDGGAKQLLVQRPDDEKASKALHGLTRALIANMVEGVVKLFEKKLEIVGVGYQAQIKGKNLELNVGYANSVKLPIPGIVKCAITDKDNQKITLQSPDKHAVGQFAAVIRRVRPPEPYKGKGIRYENERVRRKAGKAFAGAGSG